MKKLHHRSVIGQKGANYIERVFLDMGQVWRPTAVFDTGVDGMVEFRNVADGSVENRHLQIQVKATEIKWESETSDSFTFRISEDDLAYWLKGNIPVILVVCRPDSDEGYWISIRNYFTDTQSRSTRRIQFDKTKNRFNKDCLEQLRALSMATSHGIYMPPVRKQEGLLLNLLPVARTSATLYIGDCAIKDPKELVDWIIKNNVPHHREWLLKSGRLHSLHDLGQPPWNAIIDRGTLEPFNSREWSESTDSERQRDWVFLLNRSLGQLLRRDGVLFQGAKQFQCYYFAPTRTKIDGGWGELNLTADSQRAVRRFNATQRRRKSGRAVVVEILDKKTRGLLCYRHSAAGLRFHRFGSEWYLEVSPTYYYSKNGFEASPLHEYQLAGIKRLEHNNAVAGQVRLWETVLQDRTDMYRSTYPWLGFGKLLSFDVLGGLEDDLWKPLPPDDTEGVEGELL